jgi:hypothetical protein
VVRHRHKKDVLPIADNAGLAGKLDAAAELNRKWRMRFRWLNAFLANTANTAHFLWNDVIGRFARSRKITGFA